jgi:hypothetical protein
VNSNTQLIIANAGHVRTYGCHNGAPPESMPYPGHVFHMQVSELRWLPDNNARMVEEACRPFAVTPHKELYVYPDSCFASPSELDIWHRYFDETRTRKQVAFLSSVVKVRRKFVPCTPTYVRLRVRALMRFAP